LGGWGTLGKAGKAEKDRIEKKEWNKRQTWGLQIQSSVKENKWTVAGG
jgi:hypothetical protein